MARFGYTVLGFGSFTAGSVAVGVWSTGADQLSSNRFASVILGNSAAATIAGGYGSGGQVATSEDWDGNAWEASDDNLSAASHSATGGGGASDGIYIAGNRSGSASKVTEDWNGSAWAASDSCNSNHINGGGSADSKNAAIAVGGYASGATSVAENYNGSSWTNLASGLTARYYLPNNACGGATNFAAVTGKNASDARVTTNEHWTGSMGTTGSWATSDAITTALDEDPACFGKTAATDIVVSHGETASGPAGTTLEYFSGAWRTGPTAPASVRNNYGGGQTGAGITAGGYLESAGAYQDDTRIYTRGGST
tara:strand:- start:28 stop:960 length:933 start_codon:yes stop_codon:yes gene_type:complete